MRRLRILIVIGLVAVPSMVLAQMQPQTCEEREILLREVINQDSQMRRSVEIELASAKVHVRLLKEQADAKEKELVKEKK